MNNRAVVLGLLVVFVGLSGCGSEPVAAGEEGPIEGLRPGVLRPSRVGSQTLEAEEPQGEGMDRLKGLYLDELDHEQWQFLCQWMEDIQGGARKVNCGSGISVEVNSAADCPPPEVYPHCPVELMRACLEAQGENLCGEASEACVELYACAGAKSLVD